MKLIGRISIAFSLAVLLFVASVHAQNDAQRMTVNIPFEFTVGNLSLAAGQYDFVRAGSYAFEVRDAKGGKAFAIASASIQPSGLSKKTMLKFAVVDGRHALIQIWNEHAGMGNEFRDGQTYTELAKHPAIYGAVTDR